MRHGNTSAGFGGRAASGLHPDAVKPFRETAFLQKRFLLCSYLPVHQVAAQVQEGERGIGYQLGR